MESSCRDPCKSHEPSDDILTFLQIVHQSINAPDANSFHPSLAEKLGQRAEQASDGHPIDGIARLDVTEALIQLTARLMNLRISGLYELDTIVCRLRVSVKLQSFCASGRGVGRRGRGRGAGGDRP